MKTKKEIPQGYKPSPLGPIPQDWLVKDFNQLLHLQSGLHLNPEDYTRDGKGVPYFTGPTDYTNDINLLTKWTERKSAYAVKNDILLTVKGSGVGSTHKLSLEKVAIGRQIMALRAKENCSISYIFHCLGEKTYHFQKLASGNMIPGLSRGDILTTKLISPPLPEQKAIADLLSTWDRAIETTTALIAQKELRKTWLVHQMITGSKRLKGFTGKWEKIGAGEIFKSISVKGFDSEELLSATQDKGIIPRSMLEARVTMPTGDTNSFKLVEQGDFVISLRSFQGGIEYSYYRGLVSPAYTVLKPKKKIDDEFYKQYFKSTDFIGRLSVAVVGIRDGKQISYDDFCTVKIPYPSISEQTAIANVLQQADKELSMLRKKLDHLREQKKGLMQVLLTGKKRLLTKTK